jgi:hypothetical protein
MKITILALLVTACAPTRQTIHDDLLRVREDVLILAASPEAATIATIAAPQYAPLINLIQAAIVKTKTKTNAPQND